MRAIAFGWTCSALLVGRKTVTRRAWKDNWAQQFADGDLVAAYDRQARYGGHEVAMIKLVGRPHKQSTRDAPESDYEEEGFAYLESIGAKVDGHSPRTLWRAWHLYPQEMWVVRFSLIGPPAREIAQLALEMA
jgi:hypothetical protein